MSGKGSTALKKYREGTQLSRAQAIHAKCAECCGDYADGRIDCGIPRCPLYRWQPYRETGQNGGEGRRDDG
jgi:hypothetical protein